MIIAFVVIAAFAFFHQSAQVPDESGVINMAPFRTYDINGGEVGHEIFEDYELTMIYVWTTY